MLTVKQIEQRRANVAKITAGRRAATHCKSGHEFTPENTYWYPGQNKRSCRICRSDWHWYGNRGLTRVA